MTIRTFPHRLACLVAVGAMLAVMATTATATPIRLPPPRAPVMLPDLPPEPDAPDADDAQTEGDDECPMACKSAAELPIVAMLAQSCESSALGQELFALLRAQGAASSGLGEDLPSWCFWFVLAAWIDDDIDDDILEVYARILARSY